MLSLNALASVTAMSSCNTTVTVRLSRTDLLSSLAVRANRTTEPNSNSTMVMLIMLTKVGSFTQRFFCAFLFLPVFI